MPILPLQTHLSAALRNRRMKYEKHASIIHHRFGSVDGMPFSGCSSKSQTHSENLRLKLDVPQTVNTGSTMALDLALSNSGKNEVKFYLDFPTWDFVIAREDGNEIWRWSTGALSDLVERNRSLGAGVVLRCGYVWDMKDSNEQSVPPGRYFAKGIFKLYDRPQSPENPPNFETVASAEVPFEVVALGGELPRSPSECDPPLIEIREIPKTPIPAQ